MTYPFSMDNYNVLNSIIRSRVSMHLLDIPTSPTNFNEIVHLITKDIECDIQQYFEIIELKDMKTFERTDKEIVDCLMIDLKVLQKKYSVKSKDCLDRYCVMMDALSDWIHEARLND